MKESDIDLKNWDIIKSDIFEISNNLDESALSEDLFQIKNNNFIVDSGWYEGINSFITYLIKDDNWENPVIKIISKTKENCLDAIAFCIKNTPV